MSYLEKALVTLVVESYLQNEDSVSLRFVDESTMGIFNPYILTPSDWDDLVGASVEKVAIDKDVVLITFSNGANLSIAVKEEDYIHGPEGFVVYKKGGPIIVDRFGDE